jgi:hypothetical protein
MHGPSLNYIIALLLPPFPFEKISVQHLFWYPFKDLGLESNIPYEINSI